MRTTYEDTRALDRPTLPPSRSKQLLRTAIHLLSYHFILTRRRTTVTRVAGFRLSVRPTVFHPRYFLSSKFFANFLSDIDLAGKRVADVGTGSGILALAAARAGAASVVALDINLNAAKAAAENAHANGLSKPIMVVGSNLLSAAQRPNKIGSIQEACRGPPAAQPGERWARAIPRSNPVRPVIAAAAGGGAASTKALDKPSAAAARARNR